MNFPVLLSFPNGDGVITPWDLSSVAALTGSFGTPSSIAWAIANAGLFFPVRISKVVVVTRMFTFNGATASGNTDVGIYSADGTKLVSDGGHAQSGTNTMQTFVVTSTSIGPGLFYLALSHSDAVGTFFCAQAGTTGGYKTIGNMNILTVYPLPATITFAKASTTQTPAFGATIRSFV